MSSVRRNELWSYIHSFSVNGCQGELLIPTRRRREQEILLIPLIRRYIAHLTAHTVEAFMLQLPTNYYWAAFFLT